MALTKIPASLLDTTAGLTVAGDLTVSGTTTTVNSATLDVADKNITINKGSGDTSSTADGAGITIQDAVNSSTDATMLWDTTDDRFDFSHNLHIGTTNQIGSASVPALQIGGTSTYRLGMYTTSEGAIIDNANGDDGIIFHTKTAGEAMRITSEGDVGIGTTTPKNLSGQNSLTINGSVSRIDFKISNNFRHAIITEAEYLNLSIDPDNNQSNSRFSISVDNSERMRINSSGNVGIGTSSPTEKLTVAGAITTTGALSDDRTSTGAMDFSGGVTRFVSYGASGTGGIFAFRTASGGASSTERMRINADGRVSIGTTSATELLNLAAPSSNGAGMECAGNGTTVGSTSMFFGHGSTNIGYIWQRANEDILIGTNGTERMRIQASGCVGVGSTADRSLGTNIGTLVVNGSSGGGLWLSTGDSSATTSKIYSITDGSVGELIINQGGSNGGTIKFTHNESSTPTMALLSNGVILFKTASQSGISNGTSNIGCGSLGSGQLVLATNDDIPIILNRANGSGTMLAIRNNGSNVGSIVQNGSSTSFNTSSDYRLKENIDYTWDATTRLKQLKPARFNYIADDTNTLIDGLIAHEVSSIVPEAVHGEKDGEEMQQLDYSKLVPLLIKTIQELEARIATLEG